MFKSIHEGYEDYAFDIIEKRQTAELEKITAIVANFNELELNTYETISRDQLMNSIIKKADNNTFALVFNEAIVPKHWKYILAPILKTISNKKILKKIKKINKTKYKNCFNNKKTTLDEYKWFVDMYNYTLSYYSQIGKIFTNELELDNIWSFNLDDTLQQTYTKYCLNL